MKLKERIIVTALRTQLRILSAFSKKKAAEKALHLFCTPRDRTKNRSSLLFDEAEKLILHLDGKKMIGYRWNQGGTKKLLIIHGFQSGAKKFEKFVLPMISKGYQVLAFDAQAHGDSEGNQINVLEYKGLLKVIVSNYGPFDSFMAHSFGGLAISLALEEMVHTDETRLVLIAPATETTTAVDFLFDFLKLRDNLRSSFDNLIFRIGGVTVKWLSISRAIKNIKARVLWIHDEDDDVTPLKDVEPLIAASYPNIQFMITKGLGHRRIYHQKEVMDAITSFL